jgi:hypothetical protein
MSENDGQQARIELLKDTIRTIIMMLKPLGGMLPGVREVLNSAIEIGEETLYPKVKFNSDERSHFDDPGETRCSCFLVKKGKDKDK